MAWGQRLRQTWPNVVNKLLQAGVILPGKGGDCDTASGMA